MPAADSVLVQIDKIGNNSYILVGGGPVIRDGYNGDSSPLFYQFYHRLGDQRGQQNVGLV